MKKTVALSTLLIAGLVLTGCQSSKKNSSTNQSASSSAVKVASNLGHVAGQSYSGTHSGNGTSTDPTYDYKITFNKDGSFGQEIISSKGYAARFIQQGTYKYNKSKKQVEIKITKVTETSYASDTDLQDSNNPVTLSVRTSDGQNSQTELTSAENKVIAIKDKGSYLLGSVNNVKLTKDSNPVTNFNKLANSESDAYSSKAQVVNQKTFYAKLGTSRIWISFNDDGTWQSRIIDGTHKWDIYDQGTWTTSSGELVLTTTGDIHEYTIDGDTTNPTKYSGVMTDSSRVTDNFTWKISGGNLVITSKQDSSMTTSMKVKASKVTQSYTVAQSNVSGESSSSNDLFGSQDKFLLWMNTHSGSALIYARAASSKEQTQYTNAFHDDFYDKSSAVTVVYLCNLFDKTSGKLVTIPIVYASNGNVYQYKNKHWEMFSKQSEVHRLWKSDQEIAKNTAEEDSSSDASDEIVDGTFGSQGSFIDWLNRHESSSNISFEAVSAEDTKSYWNTFRMDYYGIHPIYMCIEKNGNEESRLVFTKDHKVYIQQNGDWVLAEGWTDILPG